MLTRERMRADIAALLHEDPEEIGGEDNLIDLGLDSMRAMTCWCVGTRPASASTFPNSPSG
jgi:hypothetical protein